MKKESNKIKSSSKIIKQEESWIDIKNDALMVKLGFRNPPRKSRDQNVWTKTVNEKQILKNVKHSSKGENGHFSTITKKIIPVRAKLIIYLKKNSKYPKTTYSTKCWQHEIPQILGKYTFFNKKKQITENIVSKYFWNGQTYQNGSLPFWT